jgi:outer membrane protein assembly factor BamB
MARPLEIWRKLSVPLRFGIVGGVLLIVAGVAVAGYLTQRRPTDISNPDVTFIPEETPQAQREPQNLKVEWPVYGFDLARTKFLPTERVRPPFKRVWRYDQGTLVEFAPIVVDGSLYAIDNDGVFFSLDANSGEVRWSKKYGSLNASSPAYSNGRLYAVNLEPPQALAIDAETGEIVWERKLPGRSESSPIVADGRVYFGDEDGRFFALSEFDGKTIWEVQVAGAVKAAPALHKGLLYVGDYGGKMSALNADDGKLEWRTSDLGVGFGRTGRFYSTPAVAFGRVYAGNVDGRVYSFDRETGEIAWTHSARGFVYSGIAAADTESTDPAVYFGSHDKSVYALDARTGDQIWENTPGGQVSGPATVIGNVAYVSTFSGNATVGFNIKTGKRVFKLEEGEYGPVVSDGRRMYLVGAKTITALKPISRKNTSSSSKANSKGVVPGRPKEIPTVEPERN